MTSYTYNENWHLDEPGVLLHNNWIGKQLNPFRPVTMFGAVGDGLTDNTGSIQAALDAVPNLYFPGPATYLIDGKVGLLPQSYQNILLHPQAVIQVAPNDWGDTEPHTTRAFYLNGVSRAHIRGGQIIGDRIAHIGSTGEWGYGVDIRGSTDVVLQDMAVSNCWGDGVFLAGACGRIHLERVLSDNNRRQGVGILQVDGLTVTDCVFSNTNGTDPQAGVNIEPDPATVENIIFTRCLFKGNTKAGFQIGGATGTVRKIRVVDCRSENNQHGYWGSTVGQLQIMNSSAHNNTLQGFFLTNLDDVILNGILSRDNGQNGIQLYTEAGLRNANISIVSSIIMDNGIYGIRIHALCDGVSLIGNRLTGNMSANLSIEAGAQNITNVGNVAP